MKVRVSFRVSGYYFFEIGIIIQGSPLIENGDGCNDGVKRLLRVEAFAHVTNQVWFVACHSILYVGDPLVF